jgi:hypothetical protein
MTFQHSQCSALVSVVDQHAPLSPVATLPLLSSNVAQPGHSAEFVSIGISALLDRQYFTIFGPQQLWSALLRLFADILFSQKHWSACILFLPSSVTTAATLLSIQHSWSHHFAAFLVSFIIGQHH